MASTANISDDYELVLMGAASVGKTCIMKKWISNEFSDEYIPTKHNSETKRVMINDRECNVEILDTAGLSSYWSMRDSIIRQSHGIMIVFSITDNASFEMLSELHTQVKRNISESSCVILVGNKHDLEDTRRVTYDTAVSFSEQLGTSGLQYIETSARSGHNISEAFVSLIKLIMDKRLEKARAVTASTSGSKNKCVVM